MVNYYAHINLLENSISKGQCPCSGENIVCIEITQDIYNNIEKYIYVDGELILDPDYEEKQRQAERQRLNALELTRGDVFIGLIQARMINEQMLKAQIEAEMPETTDEEKIRKMLAINALENALHFHRGHDLVNEIGSELGISEENLDHFFETGDYHYLLPQPETEIIPPGEDNQETE